DAAPRRDALEARDAIERADQARAVARGVAGTHAAAHRARPVAHGAEAERLTAVGARKAQRRPRHRHLDVVALGRDASLGVPDGVPRPVFRVLDVAVDRVHLHAARVDAELIGAP